MPVFKFSDGKETVSYEAENEADAIAALAQDFGSKIDTFQKSYSPVDTAQDVSIGEQYFPQTSKQGLSVRSVLSDISSAPSRFVYGLGKGYSGLASDNQSGAQKEFELGMAGRHPEGGLVQDIAKSPSTGLGIATAPITGGAGLLSSVGRVALSGIATEGAGSYLESGKASPEQMVAGGAGGVVGGAGGRLLSLAKSGVGAVSRLGQEITGSSAESLQKASTQAGREAIKQAAGQETNIAKNLVKDVMDWENYSDEWNGVIKPAIDGMDDINISPALKVLNDKIVELKSAKTPDITGARQFAINKLEETLSKFRGGERGFVKTKYSGNDVYDMRKQLDSDLDFSSVEFSDQASKDINTTLKKVRAEFKNSLLDAAEKSGNTQYKDAMVLLSKKLDAKDRLLSKIGTKQDSQLDRAVGLIRNVESNAAPSKAELIEDIDNLFGKNYGEQAKNAVYARDLAPADSRKSGEIAIYPRQSTGRSGLGGLISKAVSPIYGPSAFSNVYIPAARAIEAASDKTSVKPLFDIAPSLSRFGSTRLSGNSFGDRRK